VEVTLALISRGKSVAKSGEYVIDLHGPEGNGVQERDVDAAAHYEVECIVARNVDDARRLLTAEVAIEARMGATKQCFSKRFEVSRA